MNLLIAEIQFRMHCADLHVNEVFLGGIYRPFTSETEPASENRIPIDVRIETDRFPDFNNLSRIFDTRSSWSIYKGEGRYFWVDMASEVHCIPSRVASFRRNPGRVTIFCRERFLSEGNSSTSIDNPVFYPLDQVLVMYALAEREGAIMHACGLELGAGSFLFPGKSGAGKTTISRLLGSRGHPMLSDDRVVVRKIDGAFHAYGTPWAGEGRIAENRRVPLKGMLFLRKSDQNRIEKISPIDAFHRLMPVTSIPWFDADVLPFSLAFCEDLITRVPAYDLHFRPDTGVVDLLEDAAARL